MQVGLSLVLPSYKEADNLCKLLPKLTELLSQAAIPFEILVVDTVSPMDGTKSVCCNCKEQIKYIRRRGGNFYGDAVRTGLQDAKMPWIAFMDADGSHSPEDLLKLYQTAVNEDLDVCIGSRYVSGGNSHNGFILKLMSYCVNLVFRLIFNLKVHDVSDSFRVYKAEKVQALTFECNNFDIVEEILIQLSWKNKDFKVKEVPIFFNKREAGKTKRSLVRFIFSYFFTIARLLKIKRRVITENYDSQRRKETQ